MSDIRFAWRQDKYDEVQRKHNVSFGEAVNALLDPNGLDMPDTVHWERSNFIGRTHTGRLLVVVYTIELDEDAETIFRLITAYDASKEDRNAYQER